MSSNPRLSAYLEHLALMAVAVAVVTGCDRTGPTTPDKVVVGLTLTGPASISHPGETAGFVLVATYDDGSSRDVTADAAWTTQRSVLTMVSPGLARAEKYGTEQLTVSYRRVRQTAYVRVAPEGAFVVQGSVRTEGGQPVPDARVEFVSHCGTLTAVTDEDGRYALAAQGPATMRVGKEGYEDVSLVLDVSADGPVDFTLRFAPGHGNSTTRYQLTISASPLCTLPSAAMQRTYEAVVEQIGSRLTVNVTGGDFVAWEYAGFTGQRTGDAVQFVLRATYDDGYNLIERIPDIGDVHFSGKAEGTYDEARFVVPFSGTIDIRPAWGNGITASCRADNHQLEFVRLGGS